MSMYKDIARCKPCKFRVGSAKAAFYVHPAAIAGHSKELQDLTLESAANSAKYSVSLEDVDEVTFTHSVEYLYTGEYAVAEPTARLQSAEASAAEDSDDELAPATSKVDHDESISEQLQFGVGFGVWSADAVEFEQPPQDSGVNTQPESDIAFSFDEVVAAKKKPKQKTILHPSARELQKPQPVAAQKVILSAEQQAWKAFKTLSWPLAKLEAKGAEYYARPNETGDEDYSRVLLSHARLHVFACTYDISRLRSLKLQKLHKTLVAFTIFDNCAQDIAELLLYSYSECGGDNIAELRKLVIDYVACNVKELMKDASFKNAVQGTEASFASPRAYRRALVGTGVDVWKPRSSLMPVHLVQGMIQHQIALDDDMFDHGYRG